MASNRYKIIWLNLKNKYIMKTNFSIKTLATVVLTVFTSVCGFAQDTPQLTDPQIAKVAVVANQIDIDYAKLAIDQSKNPEVREFANTMINDHSAIIKQAVALVTKLGVVPQDNAVSESLLKQADETTKTLKAAKGKADEGSTVMPFCFNNAVAYTASS